MRNDSVSKMKRVAWIDAYKGLLITLVVLGHSLQFVIEGSCENNIVWRMIYSFHMPCFFMVSGLFAAKVISNLAELVDLWKRRFTQLFIPMVCWQIIYNITPPISSVDYRNFVDCGVYWFLWALFFITIIYSISEYIASKLKIKSYVLHIVFMICMFGIMVFLNYREHGFHYIAYYYPYYIVGRYYQQLLSGMESRIEAKNTKLLLYCSGLALWLVASFFWNMHEAPVFLKNIPYVSSVIMCYIYRYLVAFLAIFVFYGLTQMFWSKSNSIVSKSMGSLGVLSLGIYTVHILLFKLARLLQSWLFQYNKTIIIMGLWLLMLLLSFIFVKQFSKNKVIALLLLGKHR